jgi:hypothetical protein
MNYDSWWSKNNNLEKSNRFQCLLLKLPAMVLSIASPGGRSIWNQTRLRQADSQSLTSPSRIDTWKRLVRSIPSALSSPANLVPLAEPVFGSSCIAIWTAPLTHFGEIVSGVTASE